MREQLDSVLLQKPAEDEWSIRDHVAHFYDAQEMLDTRLELMLEQGAEVRHVQVRSSSAGRMEDEATNLSRARELLTAGSAKAIQIRYRFEQQDWCDTLMVGPERIRIIRTREI